jgi:hypothetical protein
MSFPKSDIDHIDAQEQNKNFSETLESVPSIGQSVDNTDKADLKKDKNAEIVIKFDIDHIEPVIDIEITQLKSEQDY